MREIIITTESGSDLPENLVKKYDIKVIPMHIVMMALPMLTEPSA